MEKLIPILQRFTAMWIRIKGAKPMLIHAEWIRILFIEVEFLNEYLMLVTVYCRYVIKHTNVGTGTKRLFESWKSVLFVKFGKFPCSWIRIHDIG
jgi:hypothetical protein